MKKQELKLIEEWDTDYLDGKNITTMEVKIDEYNVGKPIFIELTDENDNGISGHTCIALDKEQLNELIKYFLNMKWDMEKEEALKYV